MNMLLEKLLKILADRGLLNPNECVRWVAAQIVAGTLAESFRTDPGKTLACIGEAAAVLVAATLSRFHDHADGRFGTLTNGAISSSAVVTTVETVESINDLARALGVNAPVAASGRIPAESLIAKLVLQQLIAYVAEHLPEILDSLIDKWANHEG